MEPRSPDPLSGARPGQSPDAAPAAADEGGAWLSAFRSFTALDARWDAPPSPLVDQVPTAAAPLGEPPRWSEAAAIGTGGSLGEHGAEPGRATVPPVSAVGPPRTTVARVLGRLPRFFWLPLLSAVIATAAAAGALLPRDRPGPYVATVALLATGPDAGSTAADAVALAALPWFAEDVAARVGVARNQIDVTAVRPAGSTLVDIQVRGRDSGVAADASLTAAALLARRAAESEARRTALVADPLLAQVAAIDEQLRALGVRQAAAPEAGPLADALALEASRLRQVRTGLTAQLDLQRVQDAARQQPLLVLEQTASAGLVHDPGTRPLALAALLGLLAGAALAVLLAAIDDRIDRTADLTDAGLLLLGHLAPARSRGAAADAGAALVARALAHAAAPTGDAWSAVLAAAGGGIDAPAALMRVAHAASSGGGPTVVVDADLLDRRLSRRVGAARQPGLTDVLTGRAGTADALMRYNGSPPLITAGTEATAVLEPDRLATVIRSLHEDAHAVLVAAPPLDRDADAVVLATATDGLVLLVRPGRTRWPVLMVAAGEAAAAGVRLLGVVAIGRRP